MCDYVHCPCHLLGVIEEKICWWYLVSRKLDGVCKTLLCCNQLSSSLISLIIDGSCSRLHNRTTALWANLVTIHKAFSKVQPVFMLCTTLVPLHITAWNRNLKKKLKWIIILGATTWSLKVIYGRKNPMWLWLAYILTLIVKETGAGTKSHKVRLLWFPMTMIWVHNITYLYFYSPLIIVIMF